MFDIVLNKIKESQLLSPARRLFQPLVLVLTSAQNRVLSLKNSMMPTLNFYDKYASRSRVILSHCLSLNEASQKATQYRLPLVQICIECESEEDFIAQYLLNSFAVAQFLNQNFVVFGSLKEISNLNKSPQRSRYQVKGTLNFRKFDEIYGKFLIQDLPESEDEIFSLLQRKRNEYYQIDCQPKYQPEPEQPPSQNCQEESQSQQQIGEKSYREPQSERPLPSVSQFFQP